MTPKKFRWSKVYESSEHELLELLQEKNITATRIAYAEFEKDTDQLFAATTQIWCVEGSAIFELAGSRLKLQAGDALVITKGTSFDYSAGLAGCVVFASEAPPGILLDD